MSFDLGIFPPSGPANTAEVRRLQDAEEQRLISGVGSALPPLGPEMARFVDEVEQRWPSLEDDPENSPWSITPLWEPSVGGGVGLCISWSCADSMRRDILEIATRVNVIVYDPQAGLVFLPGGETVR